MFAKFAIGIFLATSAAANPFSIASKKNNLKANYMNNLMNGAKVLRRLDEEVEVDISSYFLKFQKCQFVKSYNVDAEQQGDDEYDTTVLQTDRFIIFRLCPSDSNCNYNYGEYLVDMETYLASTVQYAQQMQEEMCEACDENCANDDAAAEDGDDAAAGDDAGGRRRLYDVDCDSCVDECEKIENMEENGYMEATDFLECQQLDAGDDDANVYFAGSMCASSGDKIKIGVFLDDQCNQLDNSLDVEDLLEDGAKLSHALLKTIYQGDAISCLAENEADDDDAADETNEVCQEIYETAAKCEVPNNFNGGIASYANYDNYDNQVAQEEEICDFIDTIAANAYDQSGEIVISGSSSSTSGGSSASGGQKFALVVLSLGTAGLAMYAATLHAQLTKGGGKADLSQQGTGAMA